MTKRRASWPLQQACAPAHEQPAANIFSQYGKISENLGIRIGLCNFFTPGVSGKLGIDEQIPNSKHGEPGAILLVKEGGRVLPAFSVRPACPAMKDNCRPHPS